eukprot:scaffold11093_cov20-Tisochrysis_lutea.AAC.1
MPWFTLRVKRSRSLSALCSVILTCAHRNNAHIQYGSLNLAHRDSAPVKCPALMPSNDGQLNDNHFVKVVRGGELESRCVCSHAKDHLDAWAQLLAVIPVSCSSSKALFTCLGCRELQTDSLKHAKECRFSESNHIAVRDAGSGAAWSNARRHEEGKIEALECQVACSDPIVSTVCASEHMYAGTTGRAYLLGASASPPALE